MDTLYEFLEDKNEYAKKTHVVVECRGKKEDAELELEFRRICDGNIRLGIHLPFEILFSDKRAMSSGLQLADLVARPIRLNTLRPNQENRAFDALKLKLYRSGLWKGQCLHKTETKPNSVSPTHCISTHHHTLQATTIRLSELGAF
jgi:hypothetical protein